tara:strand:- start:385 stop:735 length:351 start_codon:yes stop_codon:yes gene_type:complete
METMPNPSKKSRPKAQPKTQAEKKPLQTNDEGITKEELKSFIEQQVVTKLGQPPSLNFVRASNIFDNRWRVDVWCNYDSTETIVKTKCSHIFHSYFIHVDKHGKITKSDPEIKKEY